MHPLWVIGNRLWRLIHFVSYAVFAMVLLHCLFSGTDSGNIWVPNHNANNARGPNSDHSPGGVMVAMCDGHVMWIGNSITPDVFVALGSRAGGEVISGSDFQ